MLPYNFGFLWLDIHSMSINICNKKQDLLKYQNICWFITSLINEKEVSRRHIIFCNFKKQPRDINLPIRNIV